MFKELKFIPTYLIIALGFLLPIIFLPNQISSLQSTKSIAFMIILALSLIIWLIYRLKDEDFNLPGNFYSLSLFLVPLIYIVNGLFSTNRTISIYSKDFAIDSVLNIVLLFVLIGLVSTLFQNTKRTVYLYLATISSVVLINLYHLIKIPLINFIPNFNFFLSPTSNTIGQWYDLAIFAGFGLLISIISIELFKLGKKMQIFLYVSVGLSLVMLIIIGFRELWFVIGIFFLLFFVFNLTNNRVNKIKTLPVLSLIVFLIAFVFIIAGPRISSPINELLKIDFIEARPNLITTFDVAKNVLAENPVFGQGPARFDIAWAKHKSVGVNLSDFWSNDFAFGSGFLPTLIVTVGILGILPWVFFFVMYLFMGYKSLFRKEKLDVSRYITISSFVISLYFWVMNFIYVPSITILFLTALFTGIFTASLYREGFLKIKNIDITTSPRAGFLYIFFVVLFLISTIAVGYYSVSRFVADLHYQKAILNFNSGNTDQAFASTISALSFTQNDNYFRLLSIIENNRLGIVVNNPDLSDEDRSTLFQQILTSSVQGAQAAINYDADNYVNYLNLGSIYENLSPLGIEGVYEQAKQNYQLAQERNKNNPSIYLAMARLEIQNKNYAKAREFITQSLQLKPNYTEAVYVLAQMDVLEGNLDEAIRKVEQATLVRPNDPVVYFQLGLLKYQKKDFVGSVRAFENAVIRNPYFANAKYFLGLSYYEVSRNNDAILQFEDLVILDPNNEEVKLILSNMKAGKAPFIDAEPPIDDEPENRDELPLEEEADEEL